MELVQAAKRFTRLAVLEKSDAAFSFGETVTLAMSHPCAKPMTFTDKGAFFAGSAHFQPDIFIVDIDLIGSDEHLARLAAQHPQAILIVFGAEGSVSRMLSVLAAGAHDFIAPPYDMEKLAAKIDALLTRTPRQQRAPVQTIRQAAEHAEKSRAVLMDATLAATEKPAESQSAANSSRRSPSRPAIRDADPVEPLWAQERRIIEHALNAFDGNISQAAAALEISPSTIYRKKQSWADRLVG